MRHIKTATFFALIFLALINITFTAVAKEIPAQLPDPDGRPGDPTKPVQVYILAGQSNMVGMGTVSGARCRYSGIYMTADPAAPKGPMQIYPVGHYKIVSHGIYISASAQAAGGATASIYKGTYTPATDYDEAKPAKTEFVHLGVVDNTLPTISGPHTVVVRGYIDIPESGDYTIHPGYGDSACNETEVAGKIVYRKSQGEKAVTEQIALEPGRRYPITITYFKGGSTALWLSREDLPGKGDLETAAKREKKFPHLVDDKGDWTVRNDVYYYDGRIHFKGSPLSPASNGKTIGPELGFGHVLGTYHDEQVLLIKTAMGNRALGFDFRPPSSGRTDPDNKWESLEYKLMVEGVRKTLDQIDKIVPGYKGQGYEIAGFVWWQGHKDSFSPELIEAYEENLVNLINDVRKEFKVPTMPAVIATVGFGGRRMADKFVKILTAQMAVGDAKKHPEFAGTVASVDTRPFWREVDDSPANQDYHYNRNGETYMLTGDALGRAMVRLLGGKAETPEWAAAPQQTAPQTIQEPAERDENAAQAALAPIIIDGVAASFVNNPRNKGQLLSEAGGERPKRQSQFLRGTMYRLLQLYRTAGIDDYDWHTFGPDLREVKWEYYSFDPPEKLPREKGPRFRKVTYPEEMENWFAPGFDAQKAGWKQGLPPFGQLDGKLEALRASCTLPFCGCGITPKTLWEKEVLLLRGTFEFPPLKEGHRYRIVVGGSAHVNAGDGYALYINGRLLAQSSRGVGRREGAQPRGGYIYNEFRDEFKKGKVTIAAISFLRYNHPRQGVIPPCGHISIQLQEQKIPPIDGQPAPIVGMNRKLPAPDVPAKPLKALQAEFRKLQFGMFIHFNMATYKGVQWVTGYPSPSTFNPGSTVDTDAWADAAVSAGMKYGVLTAKHVAGFCLWDSRYTAYDVMHPDCPYKKDLVAQFIKSFKSRGLKTGLYYCWRHPGFGDPEKYKVLPPECDPATHSLEEQKEFQKKQIAELLTRYPDVFYIWNDGLDPIIMPAEKILPYFKKIRPNMLASSNWWSWAKKGTPYADIAVKEMRQFPEDNTVPGETCWCLERSWFWQEGTRSKPADQVMRIMTTADSRNSNFLLNVGPDKNGAIEESSLRTLEEIGTRLKKKP